MKTEFKSSHFIGSGFGEETEEYFADRANAILPEIKEAWKTEMLSSATVVYGDTEKSTNWWTNVNCAQAYQGLLIEVKPFLKTEPCKHEPGRRLNTNNAITCAHCGVKLVAEWKVKS